MRSRKALLGLATGVLAGMAMVAALAAPAAATVPPTDPGADTTVPGEGGGDPAPPTTLAPGALPPAAGPLVVIPAGCATPDPAAVVFEGRIMSVSTTAARFQVLRVLAGSVDRFLVAPVTVDVEYGDDRRFLDPDQRYVVGAAQDPVTGGLTSVVRTPQPLFGGDAVIGLDDSDVACPRVEDPVRTLLPDGTAVDSGVLRPLQGQESRLLRAVLLPSGVALVILVGLVLLKHTVFAVGRSVRELALEPEDLGRTRSHGPSGPSPRRRQRRQQRRLGPVPPGDVHGLGGTSG